MGLLNYFSPSKAALVDVEQPRHSEETKVDAEPKLPAPVLTTPQVVPLPLSPMTSPEEPVDPVEKAPLKQRARRFSFKTFTVQPHEEHKHTLSAIQEREKKEHASSALSKRLAKPLRSNPDKRAEQSALIVRSLIIGPTTSSPVLSPAVAKPQMSKLKSQLIEPKSANRVIAHLRQLSTENGDETRGPIHAVCLAYSDEEEHQLHFSKLDSAPDAGALPSFFSPMNSAPVETLSSMLNEMHVIDLVKSPDLGLGQPGDGKGIFAGALPTAETVINGIEQITPQLMALGYATGRAIIPDHTGIHPPIDRMSVLTYWWGLEVVLPPPSLVYLSNAHSVSGAVVNFLSALALINNGVREILPFIRYISQFIDFEFKTIQSQDRGKGVVCAATWIMPAAMVPRPWDFTPPQPKKVEPAPATQPTPVSPTPAPAIPIHANKPSDTNPLPSEPTLPVSPSTPTASLPVEPFPSLAVPTSPADAVKEGEDVVQPAPAADESKDVSAPQSTPAAATGDVSTSPSNAAPVVKENPVAEGAPVSESRSTPVALAAL